ncbi:tRNA (guanosine(46)-N7)-methyltransferase TrmB [bacterium]|nr:tRNA (guanosine(46)-N7)-methyltransferase TrmB [bacterium]
MTADPPSDLFPYFRTLNDVPATVNWAEFFGNTQPVELDIGCGRGLFLFNSTEAHPETNFLGLELDYTEGRRGARRLQKREFPNGRVIGGDAHEFLRTRVAAHSVSRAHVYFPDPWWKRRHRKRRLYNEHFVDLLSKVVMHGGEVHSWTDVEEYFGVISGLMNHHADFEVLPAPVPKAPAHDMDYLTSFHRRRTLDGANTYTGCWRRK